MKSRHLFRSAFPVSLITVVCSVFSANLASAASQTWDGDTDANWSTAGNWVGNAVPGILYTPGNNNINTTDVATFNGAITLAGGVGSPVVTVATRMIGRIVFDTANAGSYVIGEAVTPPTLTFGNNLTILDVTSTVVNPQTINSPVALHLPSSTNGAFTFQNNAAASGATLTLAGGIVNSPNSSRGTVVTMRGSNTGENTISGNITLNQTSGVTSSITKTEAGTWVLSGTNAFASGGGMIVSDGVLAAANNAALGTNGTANTQNATINGGVLEIRNGITIDNGVSLNLNNGGTIRGVGAAATNGRINVGAAVATSVTISTVGSGDVFTIGNGTNDLNGGASDSVINISGPGTVVQNVASAYAGTWSVNSGVLRLGSATALGTQGSVNVAGGAKLQIFGNSPTVALLTGSGQVTNGFAGTSTLTTNVATSGTFGGQLQDGVAGTLALVKSGPGTLNLSGTSNYTGATTVSTGVLNLTGSLGNTAVSGGSGAILSGTGTITGGVTAGSGVHLAPGDGGDAAIGTLTTGTLAINADSLLDFGITNTSTLDKINVTTSGGLTIDGGQININGGTSAFTANGVYNLIGYTGAIGGTGTSALTVNGLNKSVTKNYTIGATGTFVTLTVADSGVVQKFWNVNADGNWSTGGNWTPASAPNAVGAFAGFGGGGTEITADRTITVNGAFTVGTLALNGAANSKNYTLAAGGGAMITLDNGASGSFITDTSGNHIINSPLNLTTFGATFTVLNAANTLTVGGAIEGGGLPFIKGGAGTLALNGANTYFSDTTINAGTVQINSASSLGDAFYLTTINAGTLRSTADITSTRSFNLGDLASTISVASGTTYTLGGTVADAPSVVGTLNKSGGGTLVLNNSNTYSGGTVINAGIVSINSATSLGNAAGALTINAGTLQSTANINNARNIVLGNAASTIQIDPGTTYTVGGAMSGSGTLIKTGSGTLTLSAASSYTGGTLIKGGAVSIGNNGSAATLGSGTVTFEGGTLTNSYNANNAWGLNKALFVGAGQTGTLNMGNRISLTSTAPVTGSGTLNVNLNTTVTRDDLNNSWTGFTGQVNFAGTGTARMLNNGGTFDVASFTNCSVDISGSAYLQPVTNSGGNVYTFGALSGTSATAGFAGGTAGTATLNVGGLGTTTAFAGQITGNCALTKVGAGALTLSGTNTYTGATAVNVGSLLVTGNNSTATGAVTVANDAVLGGNGNLGGNVTISAGGHHALAVAATEGTQVTRTIGGVLNLTATDDILDLTAASPPADGIYTLVTATGGITGQTGGTLDDTVVNFSGVTGTVSVVGNSLLLTVGTPSPYSTWAASKGLTSGNNGPTQDPEFDGIPNELEFVLGGNPLASDTSILPVLTTDASYFIFTFNRADASMAQISLSFEYGSTLSGWTPIAIPASATGTPVNITDNGATDQVQVKILKTNEMGGKLFGRLKSVK